MNTCALERKYNKLLITFLIPFREKCSSSGLQKWTFSVCAETLAGKVQWQMIKSHLQKRLENKANK